MMARQDRQELVENLIKSANRLSGEAAALRARAAELRRSEQRAKYPDPGTTRAILDDLESRARRCEKSAREERKEATELAKPWWRRPAGGR